MTAPSTIAGALQWMLRHPWDALFRQWNYKSAILSASVRASLFFGANSTTGIDAAIAAMTTEFCFRICTAGFYGAVTQSFRRVEPAHRGTIAAMIVLPLLAHSLELAVHWWRGTPALGLSMTVSVAFTALSTAFNLFAMRRVRGRRRAAFASLRPSFSAATDRAIRSRRASDVRTRMGLTSLHITNAYHPSSGGIRTFYSALLEAANRERRHVRLMVPGPAGRAAWRPEPDRSGEGTARRFRWHEVTRRYFELYDDIYNSWIGSARPAALPRLDAHVIRE